MEHPKIFISYSWHPKSNQLFVQQLAERLNSDGVHVIVDFWDLKDGQDRFTFMEQMVIAEDVKNVLIICNKDYKNKADSRKGGVGIECTIMTPEIYNKARQTKFIPIIVERDEEGNEYLPTFVKPLIYVDLSDPNKFEDNYDQLLRDIYEKPVNKRPPIGSMPDRLNDESPQYLPTANRVHGIDNAIKNNSPLIISLIKDYISVYIESLAQFKIDWHTLHDNDFIKIVEDGINALRVVNDDFCSFIDVIAKTPYCTSELLIDFFERLLQFYEDNDIELATGGGSTEVAYDNYRYFNHELFISVTSLLFKHERYQVLADLLHATFCVVRKGRLNVAESVNYIEFQRYNYTLDHYKNNREQRNYISLEATTLKENAHMVKFEDMVTMDIILYYISLMYPSNNFQSHWHPLLSIYANSICIMPKLASKRYFEKVKCLFGVDAVEEFKAKISKVEDKGVGGNGYYRVPHIKSGLCLDTVCSMN